MKSPSIPLFQRGKLTSPPFSVFLLPEAGKGRQGKIFKALKYDDLLKSLKTVTPAEAGVQNSLNLLDSRFRGNDKNGEVATFYETIKVLLTF